MPVWRAIILGIVQGLTEFLPISSSGHLIIFPWLFGWPESGLTFDVALHMGTLVAVLVYFRAELTAMALALPRGLVRGQPLDDPMSRLALFIIVGSIPAGIAGLLFNDAIDEAFHSGGSNDTAILIIASLLIALGVMLEVAERVARHVRPMTAVTWRDGILIGLAQTLALLPGVSRSGSTITAGLLLGLRRETAARFSFLLGVPAIVGAGVFEFGKLFSEGVSRQELAPFIAGMITAAVVGYLAIAFLLRYLQQHSTRLFIIYRFALGALVILLVLLGLR